MLTVLKISEIKPKQYTNTATGTTNKFTNGVTADTSEIRNRIIGVVTSAADNVSAIACLKPNNLGNQTNLSISRGDK